MTESFPTQATFLMAFSFYQRYTSSTTLFVKRTTSLISDPGSENYKPGATLATRYLTPPFGPSLVRKIKDAVYPGYNYLARLQERMIQVGFTLDDPLYILVSNAYDAMLRLSGELHYRSCEGGVA
jgi:hypothetical protein